MPGKPPGEINRVIGQRIRKRREDLGVPQSALGRAIGVSYQQIQKYERSQGRIPASRLIEIAYQMQVSVEWFIHERSEDQDA